MKKEDHVIIGVHVTERHKKALDIQKILTRFGHNIRTRLGLHGFEQDAHSPRGVILLDMHGKKSEINEMIEKLKALDGIEVKSMIFKHPS